MKAEENNRMEALLYRLFANKYSTKKMKNNTKKFEYRLEPYRLKVDGNLSSSIENAFNVKGQNGWELVQWEVMQDTAGVLSMSQFAVDTLLILATWKREVKP